MVGHGESSWLALVWALADEDANAIATQVDDHG